MKIPAEIIHYIVSPLRASYPPPNPMFGRWKVVMDDRELLVGSAMWIIFMGRLRKHFGYKTRRDLPDAGQIGDPCPGIKFFSWEYMPYTQEEKDKHFELQVAIRNLVST